MSTDTGSYVRTFPPFVAAASGAASTHCLTESSAAAMAMMADEAQP
jgi:hypothetical protein